MALDLVWRWVIWAVLRSDGWGLALQWAGSALLVEFCWVRILIFPGYFLWLGPNLGLRLLENWK